MLAGELIQDQAAYPGGGKRQLSLSRPLLNNRNVIALWAGEGDYSHFILSRNAGRWECREMRGERPTLDTNVGYHSDFPDDRTRVSPRRVDGAKQSSTTNR